MRHRYSLTRPTSFFDTLSVPKTNLKGSLIYVCSAVCGGIADYSRAQVEALARLGVTISLLTPPYFEMPAVTGVQIYRELYTASDQHCRALIRFRKQAETARIILKNAHTLEKFIWKSECRYVLLSAYAEYLAPLWAGKLRRLARQGIVFGAVVHDPVRHAVVGPKWWHRWSIAEGYSFLREAFVHEQVELDTVKPQPQLRTSVIPHGCYPVVSATRSAAQVREELQIPARAKLLLSFGHLKDYKNLDLAIGALRHLPACYLLVAGNESSQRDRPADYYKELAAQLGVAERCRWDVRHIPAHQVGNYFAAADLVLLTYNRNFCSASGVLNLAISYRRSCVASAGDSNLKNVVTRYRLGVWVQPDSEVALLDGIRVGLSQPQAADWQRYEQENSWGQNAALVSSKLIA